jgi:hypothetical protein
VNDVLISSPNMITAGGVVHGIEGLLSPILHQCNVTNVNTVFVCISLNVVNTKVKHEQYNH